VKGTSSRPEAGYFLDDVDLARDVACAPGGRDDAAVVAVEAEAAEQRILVFRWRLEPDHGVGSLRPEADDRTLGQACVNVCVGGPVGAGKVSQKLCGELGRRLREVRVDPFLPAVRALRPQAQALGGLEDRERLEVRGLEQNLGRALADLGLLAAHDPGERNRAVGVGDQQVSGSSRRSTPSSVRSLSPLCARRTTILPPPSVSKSNACNGLPSASIT
jgi:hypothetical protein